MGQTPVSCEINQPCPLNKLFLFSFVEAADLIQSMVTTSRLARAQAFDARLKKQPAPNPLAIHMTTGLMTA
jgi:hypothetical protein